MTNKMTYWCTCNVLQSRDINFSTSQSENILRHFYSAFHNRFDHAQILVILSPAYKGHAVDWTMAHMDASVSSITLESCVMSQSKRTAASPIPASMAAHVWIYQQVLTHRMCAYVQLDTLDSYVNPVRLYTFSSGVVTCIIMLSL